MSKVWNILFILILVSTAGYSLYQYNITPCEQGLEYSIGRFDNNFGITEGQFKNSLLRAEGSWEGAAKKDIFKYNPEAEFKINLIYDERQRVVEQKQKTEFGLSAAEDLVRNMDRELEEIKSDYENRVSAHERAVAEWQRDSKQYDADVSYWNSQGGAPHDEYVRLEKDQAELNSRSNSLNSEVTRINKLSKEVNQVLQRRNDAASKYNTLVQSYNNKFGTGLEFDQGEYTGEEINIYEFKNSTDLEVVLAHELGHAIGMDHVESSRSIMYYMTGALSLNPTSEDLAELKKVCRMK